MNLPLLLMLIWLGWLLLAYYAGVRGRWVPFVCLGLTVLGAVAFFALPVVVHQFGETITAFRDAK